MFGGLRCRFMNHPTVHKWAISRCGSGMTFAFLLVCATFYPFQLRGQENPSPEISAKDVEPTSTLQSERNLVIVRVIVRDGKGNAVDNLRKEDFQLFDRGKKQTILQFSVEKPAPMAAEQPSPPPSPAEPGAAEKTAPAFTFPRRFVALYFDDVNTWFPGLARARDAANHFLQTSVRPGDRVGVFTASGLKPLDFTDDLVKVRQALAELRPHPLIAPDEMCGAITPYEAYLISQFSTVGNDVTGVIKLVQAEKSACCKGCEPPSEAAIYMEAQRVQSESETRSTTTLRGIELLVRRMSTLAGQRSIVIVSDGFLAENQAGAVSRLSDRALRAGIIINAMDSRGLYVYPQNGSPEKERLLIAEAHQASEAMGTLTQNTGGIFFENNNDLEAGFRRLTALPDAAYMLAFSPENLKHDGTFHPLKVTLIAGKGLTVQARKGYFAPAKAQDAAVQEKEDLQDAVFAQNETQTFPIQVNARYFMIDKTNAKIDVVTHVDLQQARFRKEADRNLDNLTFVTVVFDRDGHYVTGQQKVLELRLRDESLGKVRSAGVTVEMELNVKAGTYLVRTVVRDSESGQISARNSTVEIPY